MTTRTREKIVTFARPFVLKGIDRSLPAGEYRVKTDEDLIESLSFAAYRRVATMIFAPAQAQRGAIEMVTIDPAALQEALERDAASAGSAGGDPKT